MTLRLRYRKPPPKRQAPLATDTFTLLEQVRADTLDGVIPDEADGWAVIGEYEVSGSASNLAWRLRSGRIKTPPGEWEFAVRTEEGVTRVFARYLFGRSASDV